MAEVSTVQRALGRFVRARRRVLPDAQRSIRSCASRGGISHSIWHRVEEGKGPKNPTARLLTGLAKGLGIKKADLDVVLAKARLPKGYTVAESE